MEVPVERSTCPWVPDALVESRKKPVRERLVEKRLVAVRPVVDALMMLASVEKRVVAVKAEDEPLLRVVCPSTLRLDDTERLVVEALVRLVWPDTVRVDAVVVASVEVPSTLKIPDAERLVVDALVRDDCPVTPRVPPSIVLPETVRAVADAVVSVV